MSDRTNLDPLEWDVFREQAHRMLDDMLDYQQGLRQRPVWQAAPQSLRERYREPLPRRPGELAQAHARFLQDILPYAGGNTHPGFMGWVQGGGTPVGMLAEMLAGGLNANLGGRDQMPVQLEWQVLHWMRELFSFPENASGLFLTGSSMANFLALLIARNERLGLQARELGLDRERRLVAYTSAAAHGCIAQAMDLSGLGRQALRRIAVDGQHRLDVSALRAQLAADRAEGLEPFLLVATAGTVDVGAIDPLPALMDLAHDEGLWCHVDGALGALGMLSPAIAPRLAGLDRADSIAFDFHKWAQVPYDAGFLLVRDGCFHQDCFAAPAAYLSRESRGLSAGSPWPCDFGPDLSRGFRALKTWFTFQVHGADAIGAAMAGSCALATELAARIEAEPRLELMAPVALNIVCFRYRAALSDEQLDALNRELLLRLHEAGRVAPSLTRIAGRTVLRAALVNHRIERQDIDALLAQVMSLGAMLEADA